MKISLIITALFALSLSEAADLEMEKQPIGSDNAFPSWDYWRNRCEQDDPLGMITGSIASWQITASSTAIDSWNMNCHTNNARPYLPNGMAWCAKFKSSSEWIQVDLGVPALITGIITQGRGDFKEWVSSYMVSYSDDAVHWRYITDTYNNQKVFEGNTDSHSIKHNYLDQPIIARYVKLHTSSWNSHPSLRFELVGCQPCKQLLGVPPYARYSASSSFGKRKASCRPEFGHFHSNKGWCARKRTLNQWFQIDLGPPTLVTGTIIKGRGDSRIPQYVTRYKLSYSNDSKLWLFYKDAPPMDPKILKWRQQWTVDTPQGPKVPGAKDMIFDGNNEKYPERIHYLAQPFVARFVRFHPITFVGQIAMRVGLIGCRHHGKCSEGFFKINDQSSCVANLAYKKSAWLGSDSNRHQKRHLANQPAPYGYGPRPTGSNMMSMNELHNTMIGDPGYADGDDVAGRVVDGFTGQEDEEDQVLAGIGPASGFVNSNRSNIMQSDEGYRNKFHQCAILEHKGPFGSNPVLYVDLKETTQINGVVIFTAGQDQESRRLIARSVAEGIDPSAISSDNLGKLTVSVEDDLNSFYFAQMPYQRNRQPQKRSQECGYVTRTNNALFNRRLHIPCSKDVKGRYLYVEASGTKERWSPDFAAILCEIMVY